MAVRTYVNSANPATTLSGSILLGATSLTLAGTTKVPATPNFAILIDSEIYLVTAINTGTGLCTVTPGAEGTTQAAHSNGANVYHLLTAGTIDAIRVDINQFGTYATLPSTVGQKQGNRYRQTDGPYEFLFDGSVWVPYWRGLKVDLPPASVTYDNQNGATWDQTKGYGKATFAQINGTGSTYVVLGNTPATPYHIVMRFKVNLAIYTNFTHGALALFEAATHKAAAMGFASTASNSFFRSARWSDRATIGSNTDSVTDIAALTGEIWFRMGSDGTTITYEFSFDDGLNWMTSRTDPKTTAFTTAPDTYGVMWNKNNAAAPTSDTVTILAVSVTG